MLGNRIFCLPSTLDTHTGILYPLVACTLTVYAVLSFANLRFVWVKNDYCFYVGSID